MSTKICPVCDTENEIGAKHCEMCGEPLPIPQASAPIAPEPEPAPPAAAEPAVTAPESAEVIPPLPKPAPIDEDVLPEAAASLDLSELDNLPTYESAREFSRERSDTMVDTQMPVFDEASGTTPQARVDAMPDLPRDSFQPPPEPEPAPVHGGTGSIVIYQNKQPAHTHTIEQDETLVGRHDPTTDAYPDVDLTPFDPTGAVSRKHLYIYREGGRFFIYPLSPAGTQLTRAGEARLLDLAERAELADGDVIILAGALATKFHIA